MFQFKRHRDQAPSRAWNGSKLTMTSLAMLLSLGMSIGCGSTVMGVPASFDGISGSVRGADRPIAGAAVQFYAAGDAGAGSGSTPLLVTPAMTSSDGHFTTGSLSCPSPTSLIYMVARNGSGLGGGPPRYTAMAVVGPCSEIRTQVPVIANEITTIAAAYALAPYMLGDDAVGAEPNDASLLVDAFTLASRLANPATGLTPGSAIPAGQTVPTLKLTTLAKILSACSSGQGGSDDSTCESLLSLVSPSEGPIASDTVVAMRALALNPKHNVDQIYALSSMVSAVAPTLSAPPSDWSLAMVSTVPPPTLSVAPGTYVGGVSVGFSDSHANAAVYYTLDGSTPTTASTLYTTPFVLTVSSTVRAIAFLGGTSSTSISGNYTIMTGQLTFTAQPTASAAGSYFVATPAVTVLTSTGTVNTTAKGPVTLSIGRNPSYGVLSGVVTTVPVNGIATFPNLSISLLGNGYTLVASSPGAVSLTSASFNVSLPSLAIMLPASTITVGQTLTGTVKLSNAPVRPVSVWISSAAAGIVTSTVATVTIPAGQTAATFNYTGMSVGATKLSIASSNYVTVSAAVTALAPPPPTTLRQAAVQRGFLMGAAVDADEFGYFDPLTGSAQYAATLAAQYNMLEAENAMKWIVTEPVQGAYNFEPGDQLVSFAQAHMMAVRGHNLVWNVANPDWLNTYAATATPAQMAQIMQDHIISEVGHWKGKVFAWDVVNEAISDDATGVGTQLKDSIWNNQPGIGATGTGYVEQAFRWAHAADPNALLFYNDYTIITPGPKFQATLNMLTDFVKRGVPINGIGLQIHTDTSGWPATSDLATVISAFTKLGLQVHITEVDVAIPVNLPSTAGTSTPAYLQAQAATYQRLLQVCLQNSGCTAFQTWGFTDNYSWVPGNTPGLGAALPFDQNYNAKPAFAPMLRDLLTINRP